jgi:inner membrane protein
MKTSPLLRLGIMGLLFLSLLIPLTMMQAVVSERSSRRNEVVADVSGDWGGAQIVGGPVLIVPYRHSWTDSYGRLQKQTAYYVSLPEALEITGTVDNGERTRPPFRVIVYTAHLKMRGRFARPDLTKARPAAEEVLWDQATVSVGISDPKGIARLIDLNWNGRPEPFVPGVGRAGLFSAGVQAPAPGLSAAAAPLAFELELDLRGTAELRFIPGGNETVVQLTSPWPHPSYVGSPRPEPHRESVNGFEATWRVPYFGRGFPTAWNDGDGHEDERLRALAAASAFGVGLIQPVDIYRQTERAVKYAALFIVLTFVIAFIWEITGGVLVHPIQYLFVGFTMCVFYLLLLSLAEHAGFDVAYTLAAAATVGLLAWYWRWVLGGGRPGVLMGAELTVLYGYLYLLLRLEDYALLAGSIGLFAMLALVMFLTRRVNWYQLRLGTATK